MSKIICDLCGTAYPETENQCPICGTAKTDASKTRQSDETTTAEGYAYVKGGRFSQSNVRKRQSGREEPVRQQPAPRAKQPAPQRQQEKPRSNAALIVIVVILLLAIISVCAYIAVKIINMDRPGQNNNSTPGASSNITQQVPCTGISLSLTSHTFKAANESIKLEAILQPAGCNEKIFFQSSNETIVRVDENGVVTPVADGTAVITVFCGGMSATCEITCAIGITPPPGPSDPPASTNPTDPPAPAFTLTLNRIEFTLRGYGDSWNLTIDDPDPYNNYATYEGPDNPSEINWSVDDSSVATVTNGKVVAVGNGITYVRAEYQGQTVSCRVICKNVEAPVSTGYKLTITDFSMNVGTTESISLINEETGAKVQGATFRVEDETVCTVDANGKITSLETGRGRYTNVIVEYEGVTYKCIVRVRKEDL